MPSRSRLPLRLLVPIAAAALLAPVASSQSAAPPVKKAEDEFMNIQVLKGVPADQILPAMQFISNSLGADCEYCHVRGSFDKDDKEPKKTARKMITMMNAINTANFDGHRAVTCFSCHHGSEEPASVPTIHPADWKEPAKVPKPASMPAAAALLDKYAQAVGGAEAVRKVSSRVQKGTMTAAEGRSFPIEVYSKAPDMRASYVTMDQGANVTAFDGKAGWLGSPGRPPRDMSAAEAEGARLDADLSFAVDVKQMYKEFKVTPAEKIGDHDVWLVTGRTEGQPPLRLYFDQQSGLLVRLTRYIESPLGRNPTQIDYEDYREADGVKIPHKWTVARPLGRFTIKIDETKTNVPVDDAKFAKPPEAPKP